MLSDSQITAARWHMGIPASGIPNSAFTTGLRTWDPDEPYFQQVALFESRIAGLTPTEEALLTGTPIAEVILTGTPGNTLLTLPTLEVSAGATELASYAADLADVATGDLLFAIAQDVVAAINAANTPYVAAVGPHSLGDAAVAPQASFTVRALQMAAFNLSLVATNLGAYVTTQGTLTSLSRTFQDTPPTTVYGLLPILDYLKARVASSGDFAAFAGAGKVTFTPNELARRSRLYRYFQQSLADFIGVELYPLGSPRKGGAGAIV
jgi:hypothetical protein